MTVSIRLPSLDGLKAQAKRLRADLAQSSESISHGRALELIAHQYGYRDWNTICAAADNDPAPVPVKLGERVTGRYLGQPFSGEITGLQILIPTGRCRIAVEFDEPVDVVTFDSFSAFRKRVTCVVGSDGKSGKKTSNGVPHMVLDI